MVRRIPTALQQRLEEQDGVVTRADAVAELGVEAVRWRVGTGAWQRPRRGVLAAQSGSLSRGQQLWVDVLSAGRGAAFSGLTAAGMAGLQGFADSAGRRWVLVPHGRTALPQRPGLVVHRTSLLGATDLAPVSGPPRTRSARALVDAATWARSDDHASALLLAGCQQGLVRPADLESVLAARHNTTRRAAAVAAVAQAVGGVHTLPEREFLRLCKQSGLPKPSGQVYRKDATGRVRWLDFGWERYSLTAEIDGSAHMDARAWAADMVRDALLVADGQRVLRLPNAVVRTQGPLVVDLVERCLVRGGWRR